MTLYRMAKIGILLAVVVTVAGVAIAVARRPREKSLLAAARRVSPIDRAHPWYWWLSEHEILRFRDPAHGDWAFVRYDERTHTDRPLDRLSGIYARTGGTPQSVQVGSDGKWMLWSSAAGGTTVASTDGARHFVYPAGRPSEKRWMCEGLRWIELIHDGRFFKQAMMHDVLTPQRQMSRALNPQVPCTPNFVDIASIAPTTDDHILVNLWHGRIGDLDPAAILAMGITAQLAGVGQITLHPPRPSDQGRLVFAPIFGRIAGVLQYRPAWGWLTRESRRTGIWTTDLHGDSAHELGALDTPTGATDGRTPIEVKWSPDGSRISFVQGDAIWAVSDDQ